MPTKYSIQNKNDNTTWEQHLEKNYKTTGTRTDMSELKEHTVPLNKEIKKLKKELSREIGEQINIIIPNKNNVEKTICFN